ncbi:DUF2793 domain-containing protein [Sphingosinicella sp. LHD-64]|uniref:DUF2793 domain-containing protein n=1 Tax=Sphingosinicella sp. LHD-64 TaxID=3072139 RepID=UPI00281082A7|nr:DUF2793 domain-containing protein [Sphingosinicella sp. LHD-64]MDQ8757856.1 DUF2793 domain-containing protein [Sphingosinicella sp. LHD-64]
MTETSARFALPFILPGQAQKEIFHNEALTTIDCALHSCVKGFATEPPAEPVSGEGWIVEAGASGAWAGRTGCLATWTSAGWRFVSPVPGMMVWDKEASHWIYWNGEAWSDGAMPAAALMINGEQVVGPRQPDIPTPSGGTTIDAESRSAIGAIIVTLKSHGLID